MSRLIHPMVFRAFLHLGSYALWIVSLRLLVLTLITYSMMTSRARFQDISEVFGANELTLAGFSAALYVWLIAFLNPLTSTSWDEFLTRYRVIRKFLPGLIYGALIALGIVGILVLSGLYRYLGFFIQTDEISLAATSFFFKTSVLILLVYAEEFLFRQKILNYLRTRLSEFYAIFLTAIAFCAMKWLQFDLGISQLFTLLLLSIALAARSIADGDFARGAGFWAGMLIVFHPLLSLPIFGADFQGILLVQYQGGETVSDDAVARWISGGLGGPLSSLSLQLMLLLDLVRSIYRHKKILFNPASRRMT